MINELDTLNEEYNNYKEEIVKLSTELEEQKSKLDEKIKNIYDAKMKELKQNFYEKKTKINNKYRYVTVKRQQLINQIHINSMFNTFEIGLAIAKLLTEFEKKHYIFNEGVVNVTEFDFSDHDKISSKESYVSAIITTTSIKNLNKKNIEIPPTKTLYNFIDSSDILLYYNDFKQDFIYFYDEEGRYIFNNKYPYIKDFIDSLILAKIDNMDNFNINNKLKQFIDENKGKSKKKAYF